MPSNEDSSFLFSLIYKGSFVEVYEERGLSLFIDRQYIGSIRNGININANIVMLNKIIQSSGYFQNDSFFLGKMTYRFYLTQSPGSNDIWEMIEEWYGKNIVIALVAEYNRLSNKKDFVDNTRVCQMSNVEHKAFYQRRVKIGCCGYVDEVVDINGEKYLIGFNYGH